MNIVLKYIINTIKDRKMRTAVMLLSIMLSTMLLLVSLSIGDSYAEAQRKMSRGMAGSATLSVVLESGETLSEISSIGHAVGIVETKALYKADGYYENFDIIAANLDELAGINQPRLLEIEELSDFTGNQIILPDRFTAKFGVGQGDYITLWINNKPYEFMVAAIAAYDTVFLRHTRGTNALIPLETLSSILDTNGGYSKILIEPAEGVETDTLYKELRSILPEQIKVNYVVNEAQVEASARQKSMPFFLISFFSLTMSIFIIHSSYKVITLERIPVIGTFRSIGANQKTIIYILMLESLVYGTLGALFGIPFGFLVLKILLNGLGSSLSQGIAIPIIVSPFNIMLAGLAAVVVSVISALGPVKRVSRLPVKDVVLGTVEEKNSSGVMRFYIGGVLLVLSIVLPHIGQSIGEIALFLTGGFSLVMLLGAAIVVIPGITSVCSVVLESVYDILFGSEGRLAARNMRGNKHISQNITLLFISVSAVIVISVVGNFVQMYVGEVFKGAKLDGFVDAAMSPEVVEEIRQLTGIDDMLPIQSMNHIICLNGDTLSRVEGTNDIAEYSEMLAMEYGSPKDREIINQTFEEGRNILLSSDCIKQAEVKIGDKVTLSSGNLVYEYTVVGSFKMRSANTDAVIPSTFARIDFNIENYGTVVYSSQDPEAVMAQIRDLFGEKQHWSRTVNEFYDEALGTVNAFLNPMQNLTWFILLLATVGIANNLLINHIQKRRTIAMYKSIGMSNWQDVKMTLIEACTSGVIGAIISILVSRLEINTIFLVAGPKISIQPELKPGTFLFAGASGIAITLLGSVIPIVKNKNMNIVEEIKFE